jgi:hypothetical protein
MIMKIIWKPSTCIFLALLLFLTADTKSVALTEVSLPSGGYSSFTNYIDVTAPPYNADSTGKTDSTQAIQSAIAAAFAQNKAINTQFGDLGVNTIVYFPNGTYLVSNVLGKSGGILTSQNPGTSSNDPWVSGMYLQGESEAGTTIQLANGTFPNSSGVAVIATQSQGTGKNNDAAAFRHYIRNMTIDTGTGNPGATGINFIANNRGGIYNVTVNSSDNSTPATTGIAMDYEYPGPAIIKNVTVKGFQTGISMQDYQEYGMTLEYVTLTNQHTVGIYDSLNSVTIRGLNCTEQNVPAIRLGRSQLTLRDSTITGTSATASLNAIYSNYPYNYDCGIYCHNVSCANYGTVISFGSQSKPGNGSTPVVLSDYTSAGMTFKGQSNSISGAIDLPVEDTPDYSNINVTTQWINAAPNGPQADNYSNIMSAINSGEPVVYLPPGVYPVSQAIHIGMGSSCQKFIGLGAVICPMSTAYPTGQPLLEFDGGTAPTTCLQNLSFEKEVAGDTQHRIVIPTACVIDNSSRALVIENCDIGGYTDTSIAVNGVVFFEDVIGGGSLNVAYPQYVFGRQVDVEGVTSSTGNPSGNYISNQGGVMWLMGYKTEAGGSSVAGMNTMLYSGTNAWTELNGGFFFPNSTNTATVPMIVNNRGHLSANFTTWLEGTNNESYPTVIQDTEVVGTNTVTTNLPYTVFYGTGAMTGYTNTCDLFTGSSSIYSEGPYPLADYLFNNSRANSSVPADGSTFNNGSGYTNTGYYSSGETNYVAVNYAGTTNNAPPLQNYNAGQYFDFSVYPTMYNQLNLSSITVPVTRPVENSANYCTVYGIPSGGAQNGQLLTVINSIPIHGQQVTIGSASLTNSYFQGLASMQFYIVFHGTNQGLGTDYVGNIVVQGTETNSP